MPRGADPMCTQELGEPLGSGGADDVQVPDGLAAVGNRRKREVADSGQ